jgi:hypothetical protein
MAQQIKQNQRTQTVSGQRNTTIETWISLTECCVRPIYGITDCIDNALKVNEKKRNYDIALN